MDGKRVKAAREAKKKKRGRPVTWTPEKIQDLVNKFNKYVEETLIPIVAEFAYQNGMAKESMYDFEELAYPIKLAITKKEANLEKGMLSGKMNTTGCIFSLKQLGWKDRTDIVATNINVNAEATKKDKEEVRANLKSFFPNLTFKND